MKAGAGMRKRQRIREAIVVEGRYDKNTLAQIVDTVIVPLDGFTAFREQEKLKFLRRLALERGLVILTDSDGAGFVLRGWLKGALPKEQVRHAYIPDIPGKERRKRKPGKEGKLGVEGMRPEILLEALRRSGAEFLDESPETISRDMEQDKTTESEQDKTAESEQGKITKTDLYEWGLTGSPDSAEKRRTLQRRLGLPERLSANQLLRVLNILSSKRELEELL